MEYLPWFHSALMLAARMTLAHFSVSSAMSFPKSAGDLASTVPPKPAILAMILGSARLTRGVVVFDELKHYADIRIMPSRWPFVLV
jgi:hypothetical protein